MPSKDTGNWFKSIQQMLVSDELNPVQMRGCHWSIQEIPQPTPTSVHFSVLGSKRVHAVVLGENTVQHYVVMNGSTCGGAAEAKAHSLLTLLQVIALESIATTICMQLTNSGDLVMPMCAESCVNCIA